ncbi:MAG: hypothetical protein IPI60_13880 [Saprospiraceae bacterium]|nr:hypothetical protein [Saprospiraceae bacterium]
MRQNQFSLNSIAQLLQSTRIKPITVGMLVLLCYFLPFNLSAQTYDLTGYWKSDVGGCYQIRQKGNEVFWAGGPAGSSVHNVFHGALAGNTLTGMWYDLPANTYQAFGASLSARVENNNKIVKVSESAPYRASTWTRINGTCSNDEQIPVTPVIGCKMQGTWAQNTPGVGSTTWEIKNDGTAIETGIGSARGQATIKGNLLRIDWQTSTGFSGYYEWTLDGNCNAGVGILQFKTGRTDRLSSSVKRS